MPSLSISVRVSSPDICVVEGPNDTRALGKALDCPIFETGGMGAISGVLPAIRSALRSKKRVVVFTDTDAAGRRIRGIISEGVRGELMHAALPPIPGKNKAFVESSSPEAIRRALKQSGMELHYHLPVLESRE